MFDGFDGPSHRIDKKDLKWMFVGFPKKLVTWSTVDWNSDKHHNIRMVEDVLRINYGVSFASQIE